MSFLSRERLSVCAIFLCAVTLGYFYDWRSQYGNLMQARASTLQLQMQINTMQQTNAQLADTQSRYNLAKKALQQVVAVFPNIKNFNSQLQTLITLAAEQGVTFVKIKPSSAVNKNFYLQVPVELEVESQQQLFFQFLKQIASTKSIFTYKDWITSKYHNTKTLVPGEQGVMLFKTTAVFYYIP